MTKNFKFQLELRFLKSLWNTKTYTVRDEEKTKYLLTIKNKFLKRPVFS